MCDSAQTSLLEQSGRWRPIAEWWLQRLGEGGGLKASRGTELPLGKMKKFWGWWR